MFMHAHTVLQGIIKEAYIIKSCAMVSHANKQSIIIIINHKQTNKHKNKQTKQPVCVCVRVCVCACVSV